MPFVLASYECRFSLPKFSFYIHSPVVVVTLNSESFSFRTLNNIILVLAGMTSFIELADVYTIIVIYLLCFLIIFFYHLFLLFHSVESSETHSDAFKNIGEKWRCLLEEQKDVFRKKARDR